MAYAYVSGASNVTNGNSVSYAPTAGNLVVIYSSTSSGGGSPTFTTTDNLATSYTQALAAATFGSSGWYGARYLENVPAGITTFTNTYNGGTPGNCAIRVVEYSGIATSASLLGPPPTPLLQTTAGTGTDAVTSNLQNVTTVPALILGFTFDEQGLSFSAGTGQTLRGGILSFSGGNLGVQDKRATVTGNQVITATTTHGTDSFVSMMLTFLEPSGGGTGPPAPMYYRKNVLYFI
jgi:hypothetical protein